MLRYRFHRLPRCENGGNNDMTDRGEKRFREAYGEGVESREGERVSETSAPLPELSGERDQPQKLTQFHCECGRLFLVEGTVIGREFR